MRMEQLVCQKDAGYVKKLQYSECLFWARKNIIFTCFKDSKIVYHLSKSGNINIVAAIRGRKKSTNQTNHLDTVSIPQNIQDYNLNSIGVDLFDQLSIWSCCYQ